MATNRIAGYKKIFGFVLPDWVEEKMVSMIVGGVLVLIVMLFAMIFVVNPNLENVHKLEVRLKTESERLASMQESKASLDRLTVDVAPSEQAAVFRAMPIEYSPEEAVFSLRRTASETGVSIAEYTLPSGVVFEEGTGGVVSSSAPEGSGALDFRNFTIQVVVEGQIKNILDFINKIQRSLPVVFVSDLAIQEVVKAAELKRTQSNVNLKLSIQYYQPILKNFNVAGLRRLTDGEMLLMRELSSLAVAAPPPAERSVLPVQEGEVRNLFGF